MHLIIRHQAFHITVLVHSVEEIAVQIAQDLDSMQLDDGPPPLVDIEDGPPPLVDIDHEPVLSTALFHTVNGNSRIPSLSQPRSVLLEL